MHFQSFSLVVLICSTLKTHSLDACSAILISGSDLLKHWRKTHRLDAYTAFLISGSDLPRRGSHILDVCSASLVSHSNPLRHRRGTHILDASCMFSHSCQRFPVEIEAEHCSKQNKTFYPTDHHSPVHTPR